MKKTVKNVISKVRKKITGDLELPDTQSFEMRLGEGNEIMIRGIYDMLSYGKESMSFGTGELFVTVSGEKLEMKCCTEKETVITGQINEISFIR